MTAYERLAALAERYAQLVLAGAWDEATEIAAEQAGLVETLPARAPSSAGPDLERALLETQRAEAALLAGLDAVRSERGALERGRRVVAAYGRF